MYTLIECLKHLAFHLFLHSIFEAYVYKKHAVFQISFVCHQCGCHFIYVPTKWNSSNDLRLRHAEKHFDLCVRFLAHPHILQALSFFSLSRTKRLGHQTQLDCFLAPTQSVSRLFPAGQFHLAWNELRGCMPLLHASYSALFLTYLVFS